MTTPTNHQQDDPDVHKGAIEGDRPTDEQNVALERLRTEGVRRLLREQRP